MRQDREGLGSVRGAHHRLQADAQDPIFDLFASHSVQNQLSGGGDSV